MAKRKRTKKEIIKFVTQYGIHIWAILIIANAALIYAYNFTTHAATKSNAPLHILDVSQISPSPSESPSPLPSTGPLGPTLNLSFTVPGIGSGGGVLKPLHTTRNVTVFLFSQDVNSQDPAVKPLYTVQGTATFDSNPLSPTYTSFVNPAFDLGSAVQNGTYQISFRTDQSLRTLIKQNPTDIGGELISLTTGNDPVQIPLQTVLMGDVIPDQGDNKIDINDYNAFINCYGENNTTSSFCKGHNYGDFNDDGVVDGIDYNILLRSLYALSQQGVATPKLSPTPAPIIIIHKIIPTRIPKPTIASPKITKKITPTEAVKTTKTSGGGGAILGVIFFLFFLILLAAGGFFLYMKNETIRNKINALIHLSPTGTPTDETTEETAPETEETPTEATQEETPADQPAKPEVPSEEPTTPAAPAQGTATTEGADYYIKKKGPDETGKGVWLTLTGDNGAVEGHYAKGDVQDGFAKIKGEMKTANGKTFLEISEITTEE